MKFINLKTACSYKHELGEGCISKSTVEKILSSSLIKPELLRVLRERKGEIDELNVLLDPSVIKVIGESKTEEELANFKPVGPIGNQLFSNFHEDNILRHLGNYDPKFYGCEVQLMDFAEPGYSFSRDLLDFFSRGDLRNYDSMGCVLNTLRSTGNLTQVGHWVAMYYDAKRKTLEYFNSSGKPAPQTVFAWMGKKCEELGDGHKAINVSNVVHQKSDTECGSYSLYYITGRMLGHSYKKFRENSISDSEVNKFRSFIMNNVDKIKNKQFLKERRLI